MQLLRIVTVAVFAAVWPLRAVLASGELSLSLSLEPNTTIAGIPVSLVLALTNDSDAKQEIPPYAKLLVRNDQDGTFDAWSGGSAGNSVVSLEWPATTLGPHQRVLLTIPTEGTLDHPRWFMDGRLTMPGLQQLQVVLGYEESIGRWLPGSSGAAAVSSVAVLTVNEPKGEDKKVWEQILVSGVN